MKIGLIGLGSIGSVLSYYILLNKDINLYVVSGRKSNNIKIRDTRNKLDSGILTSRKFSNIDIDILLKMNDIDLIIISAKTYKNKEIIEKFKECLNIPPILLAQNGINNEQEFLNIRDIIIYRMVLNISATNDDKDKDITIFNFFKEPLIYGKVSISKSDKPKILMDILNMNKLATKEISTKELLLAIWIKGVVNCCLNALSVIYISKLNILEEHSFIYNIIINIINECYEVAKPLGIFFDKAIVYKMIESAPPNYSSMYKDIIDKNPTEIEYLNGMIVKLGREKNINVNMNNKITDLITNITNKNINNNEELCENEFKVIKEFFNNKKLITHLKNYLNTIIKLLFEIGFNKNSFFSDDKNEMGNIGTINVNNNFSYILTNNATIREKVNSILNTVFDSAKKTPKVESINLIDFIFFNKHKWNKQRIEQLKHITGNLDENLLYKYIYTNKMFDLWAPIIYIYPEFVFKRNISKNIQIPIKCTGWESQMIESFSDREKSFYGKNIKFHTGKCYYKDVLDLLQDKDNCSVAGLSGHTLLLLELVKILDIDWKPMILCALIVNVPYHHSINEVIRCINTMKLNKLYINKSNKNIINNIIYEISKRPCFTRKSKNKCYKSKEEINSKVKILV
jgi:2-dehydropantoate 2-reductase